MDSQKRSLLKAMGALTFGSSFVSLDALGFEAPTQTGQPRYAMIIDLRRCIGCQSCTVSCQMENATPLGHFRTTVEQWEVTDGKKTVDNLLLPRLCNHCANPPCVPVCPVKATYQEPNGIVIIDKTVCIACGLCVKACPYDARFINPETKTADKCTFCEHRLEVGLLPACVDSCVGGARIIGDLADPKSTVRELFEKHKAELKVLKPEAGTEPYVFYIGLEAAFQSKVTGEPVLLEQRA